MVWLYVYLVHFKFLNGFWGCLRQVKGWFWEGAWNHLFTVCINLIKGIWNRAAPLILPRFSSKSKSQRSCALTRPIFFPLLGTVLLGTPGLEIFFDDRFPHVIFILKLKERTQRHYFCDQDQTLDIFAGARAEDSAIMMVANIRRARHSLLKLFQRDSTAPSS